MIGYNLFMKIPTSIRCHWLPFAVLACVLFCYWRTACMTLISYSDSAELIAVSYTLGIPHAPGYPLYMMLGKAWSALMSGDIAHRYSLLSGLWGGLTILLVFLSVKHLVKDATAAILAAASLGFSYHFWLYSLVPEISSLNGFFAALVVYLIASQSGKTIGMNALYGLGFLFGLSLSHHHTMLLWLPALAYYLVVSWPQNQNNLRNLLCLLGCMSAGFLPYLYLPVASNLHPVFNALRDSNFTGIFKFITRRNYGSLVLASAYHELSVEVISASLSFYFQCLLRSFYWSGLLLGMAGIYHTRRRREGIFLLLAFLCSGPLLFVISRMPAQTFSEKGVLEKFLSISWVLWAVFIGYGAAWLIEAAKQKRIFPVAAVILLLCISPLWALTTNWSKVDKSRFGLSRMYVSDLFKCVEPNGIILIHGDGSLFSARYLQTVEGFRPDVAIYSTSELPKQIIQQNIGRRPLYFVGLPGNDFSQMGVNGNPYYLKPRALVFEVMSTPPQYSDDQPLWNSLEFKNQWNVSDFEDVYAKETLWFYAIAHFNKAAMILPFNRGQEVLLEMQRALNIYPEFPEAHRFLERNFTNHGN